MAVTIGCIFLGIIFGCARGDVLPPTSDYDLHFPKKGLEHGLFISDMPRLSGMFTLCFWMQSTESQGTFFSYALSDERSNEVLVDYNHIGLSLIVGEKVKTVTMSINDGKWHHVCVTWNSDGGEWKVYKDGVIAGSGHGLNPGHQIGAGGLVVLGQEQDALGGGFNAKQSFKGLLTNYNLWSNVQSDSEIAQMSTSCRSGEGNVLKWSDFLTHALRISGLIPMPSLCRQ